MTKKNRKYIGMLGGGQLGLLFLQQAKRNNKMVLVYDPDKLCPAAKEADKYIEAEYDDMKSLDIIANECYVCSTEFENISYKTLEYLEKSINVFPSSKILKITQNRKLEKDFLKRNNIPVTDFLIISNHDDIKDLNSTDIYPAILKTTGLGYDGKGQISVNNNQQLTSAFTELKSVECILEKKVNLDKEVSIIAGCYQDGHIEFLTISENKHLNNILYMSKVPASLDEVSTQEILGIAKKIIKNLNYVGVIGIEFFISSDNKILVNEIAPRTHNSGHFSIEGCDISQFQQQVNVLSGSEPTKSKLLEPSVMINLLGDVWEQGTPNFEIIKEYNCANLHLYGKKTPRKKRKMGHITVTNKSLETAVNLAEEIYEKIQKKVK